MTKVVIDYEEWYPHHIFERITESQALAEKVVAPGFVPHRIVVEIPEEDLRNLERVYDEYGELQRRLGTLWDVGFQAWKSTHGIES